MEAAERYQVEIRQLFLTAIYGVSVGNSVQLLQAFTDRATQALAILDNTG
jgi:hypothetical protein